MYARMYVCTLEIHICNIAFVAGTQRLSEESICGLSVCPTKFTPVFVQRCRFELMPVCDLILFILVVAVAVDVVVFFCCSVKT